MLTIISAWAEAITVHDELSPGFNLSPNISNQAEILAMAEILVM